MPSVFTLSEMDKKQNILIETLIKGRESAIKLHNLRRLKVNFDGSVSVEDLLMEIMGSFSGGISMLNSCDSGEIFGVPASPRMGLASPVDSVPEVCTGKKPAPAVKERRGCYKRRRTNDSRVKISGTMEDAYQWRKYGQKEILNSKFPRCYFRCTHKNVHGCKALKQVQQLEEESNMFHITYFGHHTCPTLNSFRNHGIVLDFQDSKNHNHFSNSPSTITNTNIDPFVKQEVDSKAQSTDMSDNISSANDDHISPALVWNEVLLGGDHMGSSHKGASFVGFDDHEDSCASTSSHDYLDMDFFKNGDLLLLDDVFR